MVIIQEKIQLFFTKLDINFNQKYLHFSVSTVPSRPLKLEKDSTNESTFKSRNSFLPAPDIKSVKTSCKTTLATFNFPIFVRVRDETGEYGTNSPLIRRV